MTGALALPLVAAPPAPAPVPPKDCGMIRAEGRRYNVKADRIRCPDAKAYTKRYLTRGKRPSGYSCRNYGRATSIEFRCTKGQKSLFAIRR